MSKIMNLIAIFVFCAVAVNGYSVPGEYYDQLQKVVEERGQYTKIQFSEKAREQLRTAAKKAVSYVCMLDDVDQQIVDTVCSRALLTGMEQRSEHLTPLMCYDCEVADPVCYNSCPQ